MKRNLLVFILLVSLMAGWSGCRQAEEPKKVKYCFLFIGDGMGVAQVNLTEAYLSAIQGEKGFDRLSFSKFPVSGLVTTYAHNRFITCSAAAATAFACGYKTDIGRIGTDSTGQQPFKSIATLSKENGMRVGILTSVSIDHATPAAFYAHDPSRDNYFDIGIDLANSNFDFYGGGGFKKPEGMLDGQPANVIDEARKNGFAYLDSPEDYQGLDTLKGKVIAVYPKLLNNGAMPYVIDKPAGPTLADFTEMAINRLDNEDGFFMMVEGGKIDWACHSNDAASSVQEAIAFSDAVQKAIDFYHQHPDETLILVTADHETGGLALGARKTEYESHYDLLQYQQMSIDKFNKEIKDFHAGLSGRKKMKRERLLEMIAGNFGLGKEIPLTDEEKDRIWDSFKDSFGKGQQQQATYTDYPKISETVIRMVSEKAGIGWTTLSHTGINIPIYAMGVGSEKFTGVIDNTDIPRIMTGIMALQTPEN